MMKNQTMKMHQILKEEYDIWAMEMEHYLEYIDNEVWKVIQNGNSKKRILTGKDEGLEKGYDRFQQLLSQLESHGAEVSTEDANHKFLRSLPPAWSNLAMTMRTNPEIDTLSIDDLYNKPLVKSGFTGAYSTCTPSTSSTNVPEKEVLAGFADEVIYSLFAKQSEDWDLLHEDLEQIDDVDIEEMDINWQIAMIAIRMKKFYKKTGRRVRVDGKTPVGFDKRSLNASIVTTLRGEDLVGLLTMVLLDCQIGENLRKVEETYHAVWLSAQAMRYFVF
ncbi:hypothetical protein Tco_0630044 [Tanacetum coccineum]